MENHPLAVGDSSPFVGSSNIDQSEPAPPTYASRKGTLRGPSTSSSQARPNYFDLQRLAAEHLEATANSERDRSASALYTASASSSASSSRASEDGMEEMNDYNEGEQEDEEEIPRWLKNADSTIPGRRPSSRDSVFSNIPTRGTGRDTSSGLSIRGAGLSSSRNSMRSPPPSSPSFRKSVAHTFKSANSLFPSGEVEEKEATEEVEVLEKHGKQFLSSLHLMTDNELDRHLGATSGSSSRPNPSPLQTQSSTRSGGSGSTASRSVSGDHLAALPNSNNRNTGRSSSSYGNLEGQSTSAIDTQPLRVRHKLIRDLSEQLGATLQEQSLSWRAFEQERDRLLATLSSNKREAEAREEALREILTTMGVSKARVDRALVQATAEAHIPVFKVDEQLSSHLSRSDQAAVGRTHASASGEELLPASLREAMLEGVNGSNADNHRISSESTRRPMTRNSVASHASEEGEGNQTPIRSTSPHLNVPAASMASNISTPIARSAWGSGLVPWVGTVGGSRKAVASIKATSPAAVEADGYFSDGPGKGTADHSPSPTPKHNRSASISAVMAQTQEESEDEEERRSWADAASRSAFGILGTLAWRRKKPERTKVAKKKKRSEIPSEAQSLPATFDEDVRTRRSETDQDSISIRSSRTGRSSLNGQKQADEEDEDKDEEGEGNEDTIRAKGARPRPPAQYTLSGRDVITALYEAIGSAPVSPEHERKQIFGTIADLPKPGHFKAICLSTRIMTNDPGSVLLNSGKKTSLTIRKMAMSLVEKAREEEKSVKEPPTTTTTTKSSRRSSTLIPPFPKEKLLAEDRDARAAPSSASSSGPSASAATLSRALGKYKKATTKLTEPNVTRLPQLFGFGSARVESPLSTEKKSNDRDASATNEADSSTKTPMITELEPILAHDVKPPTLILSTRRSPIIPKPLQRQKRKNTMDSLEKLSEGEESSGDEFEVYGGKNLQATPSSAQASRKSEQGDETLLTDRYGFVYDATPADVRLLRRARREATHAPACLTGIRVGVRARGGTDSQSDDDKDDVDLNGPDSDVEQSDANMLITSDQNDADSDAASQRTVSSHKTAGTSGAVGSNTVSLLSVKPSRPVAEASTLSAASLSSVTPGPTCPIQERIQFEGQQADTSSSVASTRRPPSTSQTVKRLLGQLQRMHQDQQSSQQAKWDEFFSRRRAGAGGGPKEKSEGASAVSPAQPRTSNGLVDVVRKGGDVLGIMSKAAGPTFPEIKSASLSEEEWHLGGLVGLSRMGTETKDYSDFIKLIQKGVPLVYRSKIWYECSGAMELNEPGKYQELLLDHEDQENQCTNQIDLDICRTMPTNIYFAGDGPGVIKLRRLLVAFSWYNPKCGYCQGMNNLAATLLLTHATEEEAFWVLVSIIEKILPEEYYTSHLLVSQADQRVLMDLMDEALPQLAAHIRDLGVDLPAVTFAWFLSLYTDCLPVETLFRVWDVMFVEGMIVLFRIAVAIFIINEKELLETSSPSAFYSFVHGMTSHLFSVDRLIKLACEDLKSTVRKEIVIERREKHVQDLTIELGLDVSQDVANSGIASASA